MVAQHLQASGGGGGGFRADPEAGDKFFDQFIHIEILRNLHKTDAGDALVKTLFTA